jgi:hypothetical protein
VAPRLRLLLIVIAVAVYGAIGIFPYLASVLLAPPAGVAFLMAAWLGGFTVAIWFARRRSLLTLLMPPAALAFWLSVVTLGERLFGWTA